MTLPGAQLHLFCFSDTSPAALWMPNRIGQHDLHTHLGTQWDILGIDLTDYLTTFTREFLQQRAPDGLGPVGIDLAAISTDARGRVRVPVWYLHARRR